MLIEHSQLRHDGDRSIAQTRIDWEENDIPAMDVSFDIPSSYAPSHDVINGAFLISAALPALHRKESRIRLNGAVDPAIINSINAVLAQQSHWFNYPTKGMAIEAAHAMPKQHPIPNRAASFFSGGVDSLWTVRRNRTTLPEIHPLRIQDGIIVYGFDMGWRTAGNEDIQLFDLTLQHLNQVAGAAGINLLPVYTNIRQLFDDSNFWAARWHGMVLASVGYMLSGKITDIFIPSTNDLWHLGPWGSSPLIDPNFVTTRLRLYHDGLDQTRLEKMRMLSSWPVALENLRVCTKVGSIPSGYLNCGECEKCLRTKLELLVCNALDRSPTFASGDISDEAIAKIHALTAYHASEYEELAAPLRLIGQDNLANAVDAVTRRWERHNAWLNEEDGKGLIKRFLRRYLGGRRRDVNDPFPVR